MNAVSSQPNQVLLRPPLPCVASGFTGLAPLVGFVTRMGASCVTTSMPLPAGARGRVQVSLASGQQYALDVEALPSATAEVDLRLLDEPSRTRLADLLTLVRKDQHIGLCATEDVEAKDRDAGFGDLELLPRALPELNWADLDPSTRFLDRTLPLPLLITGMTGGLERGVEINRRLARAAVAFGIPMGVGSQRVALDNPAHAAIFDVKRAAPGLFLIGNLGMAQLAPGRAGQAGFNAALDLCRRAVDMIAADALALHVNVLQELIQVEGDRDFRGIIDRIADVASRLEVPLMVKEVGVGIDADTAQRLTAAGVRALDCGGKGGTSWSHIEGLRAASPVTQALGATFRDFGIPTAIAIAALRPTVPAATDLVATGGIRDGLAVAKAVALGANVCGIGLPLLRAALVGDDEPVAVLEGLARGLRVAMLISGARTLAELRGRLQITPAFRARLARFGVSDAPSLPTPSLHHGG